jgi:hypothetical protein
MVLCFRILIAQRSASCADESDEICYDISFIVTNCILQFYHRIQARAVLVYFAV